MEIMVGRWVVGCGEAADEVVGVDCVFGAVACGGEWGGWRGWRWG